jgi:hypothetical protein
MPPGPGRHALSFLPFSTFSLPLRTLSLTLNLWVLSVVVDAFSTLFII